MNAIGNQVNAAPYAPDISPLYAPYTRDSLKTDVRRLWIEGWKIEFVAYAQPDTATLPPVVILGGAFQNFNSYKYCVEPLLACGPVILVDLPALGSNDQTVNEQTGQLAEDLELEAIADLMVPWLDALGVEQIALMGLSLGSVIAAHFASRYPERMHRLILMGVMQTVRPSWRMLIDESRLLLSENRMDEFGQAVILYLVNHARLHETRMSPTAKRLFFRQMADFGENERLRYHINAKRLLRIQQVPSPTCPVLVATGQYDSFTLPFENARFALSCPDMTFALIENADHVPQLQRRKETIAMFTAFLQAQALNHLSGIKTLSRTEIATMERRRENRVRLANPKVRLTHRLDSAWQLDAQVVDLNYFGVLLEADDERQAEQMLAAPRDLWLHLTIDPALTLDASSTLAIELLVFEQAGRYVRALLKHGSFERSDQLMALLANPAWLAADQPTIACTFQPIESTAN